MWRRKLRTDNVFIYELRIGAIKIDKLREVHKGKSPIVFVDLQQMYGTALELCISWKKLFSIVCKSYESG